MINPDDYGLKLVSEKDLADVGRKLYLYVTKATEASAAKDQDTVEIDEKLGRISFYHGGVLHRTDGPAVIKLTGANEWYYKGKPVRPLIGDDYIAAMLASLSAAK